MTIDVFIDKAEKEVDQLERDLYDEIMAIIIGLLLVDGKVDWNVKNISLVGQIDGAFDSFNTKYQLPYLKKISTHLAGLDRYYVDYFDSIGVDAKSLNGFKTLMARMDNYLKGVSVLNPVRAEAKSYLLGAISSGRSMGSIRSGMRGILGLGDVRGALARYYNTFLFTRVMEFDRIVSNQAAEQAGLKYFIYAGGLIETSREFCRRRNGLIFNKDNIEDWITDPTLPETPGYIPIIDFGSFRCRHFPKWITDEEAQK
ncbi:hypothetical protein DRQ25_16465 [Candidatus Fermentibacteria bacterium]|nr:MAG: hypothetical protein DRQ25_16465 [Candidatus Fermentibacteria bacterium]